MEKGLDKVTTGVVSYRKKKMSLRRYSVADKVSFITSFAVGSLGMPWFHYDCTIALSF